MELMRERFVYEFSDTLDISEREAFGLGMLNIMKGDPKANGELEFSMGFKIRGGYVVDLLMEGVQYEELDGLDLFPNLETLEIMGEKLERIINLESLEKLQRINIYYTRIKNIESFKNLFNLKTLALAGNEITSIENIENLINLEQLDLRSNNIARLDGIEYLKSLKDFNPPNIGPTEPLSTEGEQQDHEQVLNETKALLAEVQENIAKNIKKIN
jgi:hypothetical protein